jgi:hypothetical protein
MLELNFPGNCNNEASRWSLMTRFSQLLLNLHRDSCVGMNDIEAEDWRKVNFWPIIKAVNYNKNLQIEIARQGAFWNPKIPDHVAGGVIYYPTNINRDNEGSVAAFLIGVGEKLNTPVLDLENENILAVRSGLVLVDRAARNNTLWDNEISDMMS